MEPHPDRVHRGKGVLIVFEGISGSGKSEGIGKLRSELKALGFAASAVEWNSRGFLRELADRLKGRNLLGPAVYSLLQWFGFLLDYAFIILPRLRRNEIVIADRYVYTGFTRDIANGAGRLAGRVWLRLVRAPDLLFFFDPPPFVCWERIQRRGKALFHPNRSIRRNSETRNPELVYLTRLREEYVELFKRLKTDKRTRTVIVTDTQAQVASCVEAYLLEKWGKAALYRDAPENRTRGG
ncbi:dTMP kinase [Cohnella cholangitidis]|uniref:Thymidylate kinase n=1 Tax=Cohnella cholangitidis TaxID=2598458 RepID=A0A7G5BVI9_9BACL|nr:thymidylate kinase [Cohnella cholangitidis]QMV40973.1 thymidylate kinase [Cohnella cholangitidis]